MSANGCQSAVTRAAGSPLQLAAELAESSPATSTRRWPPRRGGRSKRKRGAETLSAAITRPVGVADRHGGGDDARLELLAHDREPVARAPARSHRARPARPSCASSSSARSLTSTRPGRGRRDRREPADAPGRVQRRARATRRAASAPASPCRTERCALSPSSATSRRSTAGASASSRSSATLVGHARRRASRAGRRASRGRARRSPARRASPARARAGSCRRRPSRSAAITPSPSRAASGAESATSTARPRASPTVPGFTRAPPVRGSPSSSARRSTNSTSSSSIASSSGGLLVRLEQLGDPALGARGVVERAAARPAVDVLGRRDGRPPEALAEALERVLGAEEVPAVAHLDVRVEREARLVDLERRELRLQEVDQLDVGDELRERRDEAALEPARRLPDDVRAGQEGRPAACSSTRSRPGSRSPGSRSACRRRRARAARCGARSGPRRAARSPTRGRRTSASPSSCRSSRGTSPSPTASPAGSSWISATPASASTVCCTSAAGTETGAIAPISRNGVMITAWPAAA